MLEKLKRLFKRKGSDTDMEKVKNDIRELNDLMIEDLDYTNEKYLLYEINKFKNSLERQKMIQGENYYIGNHDILSVKRKMLNDEGVLEEVNYLPNNHVIDNQYKKMVDQKTNYLLGKPLSISCEDKKIVDKLKMIINNNFRRLLKNVGQAALNQGIGWLYPYYEDSKLVFKRFEGYEIKPFWEDTDHTKLKFAIRLFEVTSFKNNKEVIVEKVEVYTDKGVFCYTLDGNKLIKDKIPVKDYFTITTNEDGAKKEQSYNWDKIPLIPFKYNNKEISLLNNVKSLQDGINSILSIFQNNMEEDPRNTILVLVNYDNEDGSSFRQNLKSLGVIKVNTVDGVAGDVKTLQIEVNSENYKAILEIFKKALIENAMGYDAKDDRMSGNPNQMNIQSMYSDIDLDANNMETEFQASFESLFEIIEWYFSQTKQGEVDLSKVDIIFDRDMLMNESDIITNIQNSTDLSLRTRVENHPWIKDVEEELKRIKEEQEANIDQYGDTFKPPKENKGEEVNEE